MKTELTKEWIAETMKRLMVNKNIDKIRVSEICKEAGIGRPTFYYHFKDKYDLIAWIFFQNAFATDVISTESAAFSMKKMKEDFIFYKRAFEDVSQNSLWRYLPEYFTRRYTKEAEELLGEKISDPQLLFSIRLYCHGASSLAREWILKDNVTPAETIVKFMFASMPETLKKIYFGNGADA
ncbi:MAG: TetR family transcriptional regulator [Erysipelotrichaceae bacterium]|nr:TetR family transcriptional regulator [Erysipelotrichaceae bacterium]